MGWIITAASTPLPELSHWPESPPPTSFHPSPAFLLPGIVPAPAKLSRCRSDLPWACSSVAGLTQLLASALHQKCWRRCALQHVRSSPWPTQEAEEWWWIVLWDYEICSMIAFGCKCIIRALTVHADACLLRNNWIQWGLLQSVCVCVRL